MADQPSNSRPAKIANFPARFESLDLIRAFVGQAAGECGLDEPGTYAVQLAVDEACTNIIEHAYEGECKEDIQCTCQIGPEALTIVIRDCGKPFDPKQVPDPDLDASLEDRHAGGLGLYFMRQLMDEVSFRFIQDDGNGQSCNLLTLVKRKGIAG